MRHPGGGGVVLYEDGKATRVLEVSWTPQIAGLVGAKIGAAASQPTFEFLALFLVLLAWGSRFRHAGLAIAGDNLGALTSALSLSGRGGLGRISRELAWRKVRQGWRYTAGHLPAEANEIADALSRTSAPTGSECKPFPKSLARVDRQTLPDPDQWFRCQ